MSLQEVKEALILFKQEFVKRFKEKGVPILKKAKILFIKYYPHISYVQDRDATGKYIPPKTVNQQITDTNSALEAYEKYDKKSKEYEAFAKKQGKGFKERNQEAYENGKKYLEELYELRDQGKGNETYIILQIGDSILEQKQFQ